MQQELLKAQISNLKAKKAEAAAKKNASGRATNAGLSGAGLYCPAISA